METPSFPETYELVSSVTPVSGGQATVYRARHRNYPASVALKVPVVGRVADIWREVQAVVDLAHPGVVPLLGLDRTEEGWPFLVFPWFEGGTLHDWLMGDRDNAGRAQVLLPQVDRLLAALAHAHARDVLHRDIKPRNILLNAAGDWALTDFGIAKSLRRLEAGATRGGMTGTRDFTAPELLRRPAVSPSIASDLWSLGRVIEEILPLDYGQRGDRAWEALAHFASQLTRHDPSSRPRSAAAARRLLRSCHPFVANVDAPWPSTSQIPTTPPLSPHHSPLHFQSIAPLRSPTFRGRTEELNWLWQRIGTSASETLGVECTSQPGVGTTRLLHELTSTVEERAGYRTLILAPGAGVGPTDLIRRAGLAVPATDEHLIGALRGVPWVAGQIAATVESRPDSWAVIWIKERGTRAPGSDASTSARDLAVAVFEALKPEGLSACVILEREPGAPSLRLPGFEHLPVHPLQPAERRAILKEVYGGRARESGPSAPTLSVAVATARLSGLRGLAFDSSAGGLYERALEAFLSLPPGREARSCVLGAIATQVDRPAEDELSEWLENAAGVTSQVVLQVVVEGLEHGILRSSGAGHELAPDFNEALRSLLLDAPEIDRFRGVWADRLLDLCRSDRGWASEALFFSNLLRSPAVEGELHLVAAEVESRQGAQEALVRVRRARRMLAGADVPRSLLDRLGLVEIEALLAGGDSESAAERISAMEPLEDAQLESRRLEALAKFNLSRGTPEQAEQFASEAAQRATRGGVAEARCRLLGALCLRRMRRSPGDTAWATALKRAHADSVATAQLLGASNEARALLAFAYYRNGETLNRYLGQPEAAIEELRQAVEIAGSIDHRPLRAAARGELGYATSKLPGRRHEGIELIRAACAELAACGATGEAAAQHNLLGEVLKGGDSVLAVREFEAAAKLAARSGERVIGQAARLELAGQALRKQDYVEAKSQMSMLEAEWPGSPPEGFLSEPWRELTQALTNAK